LALKVVFLESDAMVNLYPFLSDLATAFRANRRLPLSQAKPLS
jgi:hypothetical protein